MKTLKEHMYEGLLAGQEETMMQGVNASMEVSVVEKLFGKSTTDIWEGIENMRNLLIENNAKVHKTTNKMKWSDKFFIQIDETGNRQCSDFMLLKRYGSNWCVFMINVTEPIERSYHFIVDSWYSRVQPNLSPKVGTMYEVPDSLNHICEKIVDKGEKTR